MAKQVRIGTSGWHYRHWKGTFYPAHLPQSGHFGYYLSRFDTVELNNSFYRLPAAGTFAAWKDTTPEGFIFSVKASRFITHMKKLKDPATSMTKFLDNVVYLGEKLGPVLFQLPPGWKINAERLAEFLQYLPKAMRCVFEFRNKTWYDGQIFGLLRQHGCAFCIYELDGHLSPLEVTADFVYIRLHGPSGKYAGSYDDHILKNWAGRIKKWRRQHDVYVYFDNDQAGYAAFNAVRLKELLA
jgi:uncharacterized protein YecE (DUF72 family)